MEHILRAGFQELGLPLSDGAAALFARYYAYLTEQNELMNLTGVKGEADTARLHFLDCAALLGAAPLAGKRVVDVGSGAGFPGLPLKIAEPSIDLLMLDSREKRVEFLRRTVELLGLSGARCVYGRAEEETGLRESFDAAVSRAVADLRVLAELCLPLVRPGGVFIAMKGPDADAELDEAKNAIAILGGRVEAVKTYRIPGTDIVHSAVVVQKTEPTPEKYPRRFAKIKKAPL